MIKVYRVNLKKYITSKDLYKAMLLNNGVYHRWARAHITENPLVTQGIDFIPINQPGHKNNFYINLEFAKELTLLAKGRKEGRNEQLVKLRQWMKDVLKQKVA